MRFIDAILNTQPDQLEAKPKFLLKIGAIKNIILKVQDLLLTN